MWWPRRRRDRVLRVTDRSRLIALARRFVPLFTTRGGKLKLFFGALGVLAVGVLLAPRAPTRVTQATLDLPVPRLQSEFERRDASRLFDRVPAVGAAVAGHVVTFPAPPVPARVSAPDHVLTPANREPLGLGLVVSADGDVLSHVSALGGAFAPPVEGAAGASFGARVTAVDPETGLVLVRLDAARNLPPAPAVAVNAPAAGDVLVAAGRTGGQPASWPVFVALATGREYAVSSMGAPLAPGTPVFSLEREVVAVAGGDGRLVFGVPFALERLGRLVADGTPLPLTLGLALQPLTAALSSAFGDAGVIVAAVEPDGPAARADIRPADVITAIGGTAVADLDSARLVIARLPAGAPAEIVLRRDGRDLVVQVAPEPTLAPSGSPPRLDADLGDHPPAADVFEARDLAAAGVSGQARVLAIAGRSVTARTATAQRRRTRAPWLVYLDHEGHRFFALVGARS